METDPNWIKAMSDAIQSMKDFDKAATEALNQIEQAKKQANRKRRKMRKRGIRLPQDYCN